MSFLYCSYAACSYVRRRQPFSQTPIVTHIIVKCVDGYFLKHRRGSISYMSAYASLPVVMIVKDGISTLAALEIATGTNLSLVPFQFAMQGSTNQVRDRRLRTSTLDVRFGEYAFASAFMGLLYQRIPTTVHAK